MSARKAILTILLMVSFLIGTVWAEKVATLEEVLKPSELLLVNDGRIYIIEDTTVFIYSLSDYKLIKKFGKKGEGPQEFKSQPFITPLKDRLLINTMGKISYFTKDGEYISEKKVGSALSFLMQPLKDGFIGIGIELDDEVVFKNIYLYDGDFKKVKKLRGLKLGKRGGKQKLPADTFFYLVVKDHIAVIYSSLFTFEILDHDGKLLKTIKKDFKRRPFTDEDGKKVHEILKLRMGARYEISKNFIQLPDDYWPAIMMLLTDGEKIYAPTWNFKDSSILTFIYDKDGNQLKKTYIPFSMRNALQPFPFAINGGKLYQLVENDDEEWELHISKIQ